MATSATTIRRSRRRLIRMRPCEAADRCRGSPSPRRSAARRSAGVRASRSGVASTPACPVMAGQPYAGERDAAHRSSTPSGGPWSRRECGSADAQDWREYCAGYRPRQAAGLADGITDADSDSRGGGRREAANESVSADHGGGEGRGLAGHAADQRRPRGRCHAGGARRHPRRGRRASEGAAGARARTEFGRVGRPLRPARAVLRGLHGRGARCCVRAPFAVAYLVVDRGSDPRPARPRLRSSPSVSRTRRSCWLYRHQRAALGSPSADRAGRRRLRHLRGFFLALRDPGHRHAGDAPGTTNCPTTCAALSNSHSTLGHGWSRREIPRDRAQQLQKLLQGRRGHVVQHRRDARASGKVVLGLDHLGGRRRRS